MLYNFVELYTVLTFYILHVLSDVTKDPLCTSPCGPKSYGSGEQVPLAGSNRLGWSLGEGLDTALDDSPPGSGVRHYIDNLTSGST